VKTYEPDPIKKPDPRRVTGVLNIRKNIRIPREHKTPMIFIIIKSLSAHGITNP
jgi:hypothetical protein